MSSVLDIFLDFLSSLDTSGFISKGKNKNFPIFKFLIFTTFLGLIAIFGYYYYLSKQNGDKKSIKPVLSKK